MQFVCAVLVALAAFPTAPAQAAGWRSGDGGRSAGYADASGYAGLWLRCDAAGRLRLFASTGGRDLGSGVDHTLILDVDGTAFLQRARMDAASDALSGMLPPGAAPGLLAALRRGKAVEVSSPAGRFTLALTGSGKALEALGTTCGIAPAAP